MQFLDIDPVTQTCDLNSCAAPIPEKGEVQGYVEKASKKSELDRRENEFAP